MPVSKDALSQLNFGYLNGSDLLQFAPSQLLTSQYDKYPEYFQQGCDIAYEEIKGELLTRYDVDKELSNANQKLLNQTNFAVMAIAAGSYVSRIVLTWNNPLLILNEGIINTLSTPITQIFAKADNSPVVQIGTTLVGSEIMASDNIQYSKVLWVNKYFSNATTLYFTISGGNVDIDLACNSGIKDPKITISEALDKSDAFTMVMPANSYLYQIFAKILLSIPSIKIGTTLAGSEIVPITVINNAALPIVLNKNYFANQTTLYLTITGGSTDLRFDIGYNFIAPTPTLNPTRNSLMVKIVTLLALRNILGAISGENKQLQSHWDWCENTILKIKERQMSMTLEAAPVVVASRAFTINSSYNTIG